MAIGGRRLGLAAGVGLVVALWGAGQVVGSVLAAGAGVTIAGFAFTPASVTIAAGESVVWTMGGDPEQHTVTPDVAGAFADSGILDSGQTFRARFDSPGTYPYHCQLHPFMKGTVVVTGGSGTPTPPPTPTPRPGATPKPTPTPTATAPTTPRPTSSPPPAPSPSRSATSSPNAPQSPGPSPLASPSPAATATPAGSVSSPVASATPGTPSGSSAPGATQDGGPDGGGTLVVLAGLGVALVAAGLLARVILGRR